MKNDCYRTTYKVTSRINELIKAGNLRVAYKAIMEELKKYPEDKYLNYQLFLINIINNNYETAASLIEKLDEEKVCNMIVIVYIKLGMEEKLKEIYNKYYIKFDENKIENRKYRVLYIYLNKLFNKDFILPDFLSKSYTERQTYNYSKKSAINNIFGNHCNKEFTNRGLFNENVDINKIYDFAYECIKNGMSSRLSNFGDIYDFAYFNCGILEDGRTANGFSAVTLVGTSNIITIFPNYFTMPWNLCEYDDNFLDKNSIKHKEKVKK